MVTGAAGGIGSEIVDRFLAEGDTVVASDLSEAALEEWRSRWDDNATRGREAALHTVAADIASEESVTALADAVRQRADGADVLINNAGFFSHTRFEDMSTEEWRTVLDINLTGTFLMIRAFVPLLKESSRGRIINIGSGSVYKGTPRQAHYIAAKGGVVGLTRVLARELGGYGITVNLLTPGLTITPMTEGVLPEELLQMQRDQRSFHRDETPADLVGTIYFLASDDARFLTGQTVNVDGGLHFL
ncbi:SDR family NAD(P)-dependent oxidoreductase [Plantactinospora sp. WMMB334]|uniref:SDR family NAD(P)-dependent oxidoreductase n=1 Tax=Plantactinospora sp. WMMB334 TaxID=3404119 RepID=UPI003B92B10A